MLRYILTLLRLTSTKCPGRKSAAKVRSRTILGIEQLETREVPAAFHPVSQPLSHLGALITNLQAQQQSPLILYQPALSGQNTSAATVKAAETKQAQLGKLLLGSGYTNMTQDYDVYYAGGPTSATTYGGYHPGIDYAAKYLTVYSPVNGVVKFVSVDPKDPKSFGTIAINISGTNDYFIFLHMSESNVAVGQKINVGDQVGVSGKTGTQQEHLHVELRTGKWVGAYYFTSSTNTGVNKNPTSILTGIGAVTPPAAPSNVAASALSSSQTGLSWQDNSANEQGFRIYRWTGSWTLVGAVGANVHTYTDSNLQPSTTYYYEVTAYNTAGEAWASTYATVTTSATRSGSLQYDREVSLSSFNYPTYRLRHRNWQAFIDPTDGSSLFQQDSTFLVRHGLADPNAVSFESINYPGYFLRHQNYRLVLSRNDGSTLFKQDATFYARSGLASASGYSFESYNYPGFYLRHSNYAIWLNQYDGSDLFRRDATFLVA